MCVSEIKKILDILALRPDPCLRCPLAIRDNAGNVYTPPVRGASICAICNRKTWKKGDKSVEIDGVAILICSECEASIRKVT